MNIKKVITYGFSANLLQENGNTFYWDFYILEETQFKARKVLEKYLSKPNKTGIKFKECVGMIELPSKSLIIDLDCNLETL